MRKSSINKYTVSLYTREMFLKYDGAVRREIIYARTDADALQIFTIKYENLINKTEHPLILSILND